MAAYQKKEEGADRKGTRGAKGYAVLAILFVLLLIVSFSVPVQKTAAFWLCCLFTAAAFLAQIAIWKRAFRDEDLKSRFLGLPLIHIGIVYLALQIVLHLVFLFIPGLPLWGAAVSCALVAGLSIASLIAADTGRGEIERVEARVQKKTFYIRSLETEISLLKEREKDAALSKALSDLSEKLRYSDPMSSEALLPLEEKITAETEALKALSGNEEKLAAIRHLSALIDERNQKCRLLK